MNVNVMNSNCYSLILSNRYDISTDHVVEWLEYYNSSFIRINEDDEIRNISIEITDLQETVKIEYDSFELDLNSVSKYWYRRGDFNFRGNSSYNIPSELELSVENNWRSVNEFIHQKLKNIFHINTIFDETINNKLRNLVEAKRFGLNIPSTYCGTTPDNSKLGTFKEVITKTLNFPITYSNDHYFIADPKTIIYNTNENCQNEIIYPSLFQERIVKAYEVRVFFLIDKFYSLKIYSQNNPNTSVDYRKFVHGYKNRYEPLDLPELIQCKLFNLLNYLKLTSASVDFIVDSRGEYVFLEINPIGQFGWLSTHGNYYIEREIARLLII